MDQVYLGIFSRGSDGLPCSQAAERITGTGRIAWPAGADGPVVAAGYGWERYPELLAANREAIGRLSEVRHPCARYLLPLGAAAVRDRQLVDPKGIQPAYLRDKVASKPTASP